MQAKQMCIGKNNTGTIVRPTAALQSGGDFCTEYRSLNLDKLHALSKGISPLRHRQWHSNLALGSAVALNPLHWRS